MDTTGPDNRIGSKATVVCLRHAPDELLSLDFLLARAGVETVAFDNEFELDNWLRHCIDPAQPILAAIVAGSAFERARHRILCKETLAARGIPLLIVDATRINNDWCKIDSSWQPGLAIYLATLNLVPPLLAQLEEQKRQRIRLEGDAPARINGA